MNIVKINIIGEMIANGLNVDPDRISFTAGTFRYFFLEDGTRLVLSDLFMPKGMYAVSYFDTDTDEHDLGTIDVDTASRLEKLKLDIAAGKWRKHVIYCNEGT